MPVGVVMDIELRKMTGAEGKGVNNPYTGLRRVHGASSRFLRRRARRAVESHNMGMAERYWRKHCFR